MPEVSLIELSVAETVVDVIDNGTLVEVVLPPESVEIVLPGLQGPANTDYQIGGTEPTDPAIKIWYRLGA